MEALILLAANTEEYWSQEFFGLDQRQRFVIILVAIGCVTGVILGLGGMIYSAFCSAHRRRHEGAMKREMIERGMSADEIARIIEATEPTEPDLNLKVR